MEWNANIIWMFPKIVGNTPKSSIKRSGFSIIFTIHFGIALFLETPQLDLDFWRSNPQNKAELPIKTAGSFGFQACINSTGGPPVLPLIPRPQRPHPHLQSPRDTKHASPEHRHDPWEPCEKIIGNPVVIMARWWSNQPTWKIFVKLGSSSPI